MKNEERLESKTLKIMRSGYPGIDQSWYYYTQGNLLDAMGYLKPKQILYISSILDGHHLLSHKGPAEGIDYETFGIEDIENFNDADRRLREGIEEHAKGYFLGHYSNGEYNKIEFSTP